MAAARFRKSAIWKRVGLDPWINARSIIGEADKSVWANKVAGHGAIKHIDVPSGKSIIPFHAYNARVLRIRGCRHVGSLQAADIVNRESVRRPTS